MLSSGVVDLVPLGLVAVPVVALFRSGRWAGRAAAEALPAAVGATVAMAVAYGIGAGVRRLRRAHSAAPPPRWAARCSAPRCSRWSPAARACCTAAGCGTTCGTALPEPAEPVLRGAAAGLAVLVGGGALLLAASLPGTSSRVAELTRSLRGRRRRASSACCSLGLLAVPTAVVWAASYAVGPGFAVGVGTAVAPSGVALGPVPALPLLGALPDTGHAPGISLVALAVPPLAGIVVGWFAARRPAPGPGPVAGRTAGEAFVAGGLAGVGLGVLAALSSGSLGAGPHGRTWVRTPSGWRWPPASRSVRSPRSSRTRAAGTTTALVASGHRLRRGLHRTGRAHCDRNAPGTDR